MEKREMYRLIVQDENTIILKKFDCFNELDHLHGAFACLENLGLYIEDKDFPFVKALLKKADLI